MVGKSLDWSYEDNLDLLISIDINEDSMVIIKGVEQDPDLGVKIVHPSIDYDSEATYSDKEENNYENSPKTPYDGENMNASSSYEGNNYEVAPDPPTNDVNINADYSSFTSVSV